MRESLHQSTGFGFCGALGPGTQDFATHTVKRTRVASDDAKAPRQGNGGNQRIAQGQRPSCLRCDSPPNSSGAGVEIQDAILTRQFGDEGFDVAMIGMVGLEGVEALPRFSQRDCRNEQPGCVLASVPFDDASIRARLSDFAHEIRVENEAHKDTRRTRSSGMRGISQFVVPRIVSYQAMSCSVVRAVRLRRRPRVFAPDVASIRCSQARSFFACLGDRRLTSLMAISTALTSEIWAYIPIRARIESPTSPPILKSSRLLDLSPFCDIAKETDQS